MYSNDSNQNGTDKGSPGNNQASAATGKPTGNPDGTPVTDAGSERKQDNTKKNGGSNGAKESDKSKMSANVSNRNGTDEGSPENNQASAATGKQTDSSGNSFTFGKEMAKHSFDFTGNQQSTPFGFSARRKQIATRAHLSKILKKQPSTKLRRSVQPIKPEHLTGQLKEKEDIITELKNDFRCQMEQFKREIQTVTSQYQSQSEHITETVNALKEEIQKSLEIKYQNLAAQYEEKCSTEIQAWTERFEACQAELEGLKKRNEELERYRATQDERDQEAKSVMETLKKKLSKADIKIQELEKEKNVLQAQLTEEVTELKEKLNEAKQQIDEKQNDYNEVSKHFFVEKIAKESAIKKSIECMKAEEKLKEELREQSEQVEQLQDILKHIEAKQRWHSAIKRTMLNNHYKLNKELLSNRMFQEQQTRIQVEQQLCETVEITNHLQDELNFANQRIEEISAYSREKRRETEEKEKELNNMRAKLRWQTTAVKVIYKKRLQPVTDLLFPYITEREGRARKRKQLLMEQRQILENKLKSAEERIKALESFCKKLERQKQEEIEKIKVYLKETETVSVQAAVRENETRQMLENLNQQMAEKDRLMQQMREKEERNAAELQSVRDEFQLKLSEMTQKIQRLEHELVDVTVKKMQLTEELNKAVEVLSVGGQRGTAAQEKIALLHQIMTLRNEIKELRRSQSHFERSLGSDGETSFSFSRHDDEDY